MMKFLLSLCALAGVASAFVVPSAPKTTLRLDAVVDRRNFAEAAALAVGTTAFVNVGPAFAFGDYTPKFADLKVIYVLGASLDKLIAKLEDPDKVEAALEGVRMFNKDPDFYPGYAQNYVLKIVKKRADEDARVGYIKQASKLIGSLQPILEGGEGLFEKDATEESIKRVKKAQQLIGKFLAESGVEDENVKTYVAAHP